MSDRFEEIVRAAFPAEKAEHFLNPPQPVRVHEYSHDQKVLALVLRVGVGALLIILVV